MLLKYLFLLLVSIQLSWQQKDPLNDFCRRFGHQSAVVDRRLYIDGGQVNWNPIAQNPHNYSNTWLLYHDLDTSPAGIGVPVLHANLSKNASIPDVSGGMLWADEVNKRVYLYGGEYSNITPNPPNLLSYDVIYDQWDSEGPPGQSISSISWGGGVGISDLGKGYVLGGWLSNDSVPGWTGEALATSTLLRFDMDSGVWTNNTGPDTTPRAEGVMVYLPASDGGILVYFGGVTMPYNNDTMVASPMSTIYVYDIKSSQWYTQKAGGNVPGSRRRFCAGAAWAPDQSSYNVYLYGGLGFGANATGFDDVYILSLPSFQWVKWWQGSGPTGKPHHSLTCNIVGKGQMLIIGGTFPLSNDCDSPITWGVHNLDLGKQTGKMWVEYQLNITEYVVPAEIVAVIGGSSLGGATSTSPAGGFDNSDLAVYFTQHAAIASRTATRAIPTPSSSKSLSPTPTSSSKKLGPGPIAGIAVGGAFVLIALLVGGCCCRRRHLHKTESPQNPAYNSVPDYSQSVVNHGQHQNGNATPHHQLDTNSSPAELPSNNYQTRQVDPKDPIIHYVQEHQHPTYNSPIHHHISPATSPQTTSPHPSTMSYGSQTSPAPTFSTVGRHPRRPVLSNETYYSP